MNCRRIEKLIPLYVEGDLEPQIISRVASHLEWCGRCNWLADEYKESQGWLHSCEPPELDDAFLEELKGAVLQRTREISTRPSVFASLAQQWSRRQVLALSAACFIVLGMLVLYVYGTKVTVAPSVPEIAKETPSDGAYKSNESHSETAAGETSGAGLSARHQGSKRRPPTELPKPDPSFAVPISERPLLSQTDSAAVFRDNPMEPTTVLPDSSRDSREVLRDSREVLRIEIQTSDPNIRIIWFAPKEADSHSAKSVTDTRQ